MQCNAVYIKAENGNKNVPHLASANSGVTFHFSW